MCVYSEAAQWVGVALSVQTVKFRSKFVELLASQV